jgi:hypothetical protein
MRSLFSALCLPLFVLLAGCSTPADRRLESPVIQIGGLMATQTEDAAGYNLALRLVNPNTVSLVASRSTHTLYLGEKRLGRIDDQEPIGLPALGDAPHTVKLPSALASQVRAYLADHPGDVRVSVHTALEIVLSDDDTLILKSTGSDVVSPR